MSFNEDKQKDHQCCGGGCGHHGEEKKEHNHGEGGCCGGHDHDHEHGHEQDVVTLTLEDGSELECPIIDMFKIGEKSYIALYHPVEETALLYNFFDYDDGSIELTTIEDDAEFEMVSEKFMMMNEVEEEA